MIMPFFIRVVLSLLFLFGLWVLFGKIILLFLSMIPFLLRKVFILFYQLVEIPIAKLHKKFGGNFYKIENYMASFGERADNLLNRWYDAWHSLYRFKIGIAILVYIICLLLITLPSVLPIKSDFLKSGERIYLSGEKYLVDSMLNHKGKDSNQAVMTATMGEVGHEDDQLQEDAIELVVTNIKSSLLVRDIPDMNYSVTLERLYNGDQVLWLGEMLFAPAENNQVEAWIKIRTENGTDGWSRLLYLHPIDYSEAKYLVTQIQ